MVSDALQRVLRLLLLATVCIGSWTYAQTSTRVTADQVAQAILNSPTASAELKSYAQAVGNLAMFESGGQLSVYNGSCCYGVLQMNTRNIKQTLNISPEAFRNLPLQDQVNAWAQVMSTALNYSGVNKLQALGTFDGRVVDGNLVLACVQLGIGNCDTMRKSGSCSGFADINGTTICKMADKIAGGTASSTVGSVAQTGSQDPYSNGGLPRPPQMFFNSCVRNSAGECSSLTDAINSGFQQGSSVSPASLRFTIQGLAMAVTFLVVASMMLSLWRGYSRGVIEHAAFIHSTKRLFMIVIAMLIVLSIA
jgi:integrating conjugative element protein (TIGR03758 family)